jgi:hypothetical protein
MSDRALRALSLYGEAHVFLRGLAVQLGFKTATVAYDPPAATPWRNKIHAGKDGRTGDQRHNITVGSTDPHDPSWASSCL